MIQRVGIIFAISIFGPVCFAGGDYLKKAAGHYQGTLTSHVGENFSQQNVQADLSGDKDAVKSIVVKDEKGNPVVSFDLSKLGGKDFTIAGPYILGPTKLKKDKDQDCFLDTTAQQVDICFNTNLVTIEITDKNLSPQLYVSLNKFAIEKPIPQEKPQVYDLQSAIKRAWQFNFDNRIEFEHVIQAKSTAKATKRNLFPHISYGTIVSLVTPSFLSIIGSAGDLLPFLFPTRWLQAKRMGLLSDAEMDAMTLLRLDTASQVEALFYNYENDRAMRSLYVDALQKIKAVVADVAFREKKVGMRTYPPGSTDKVDSIRNLIQQSFGVMDTVIDEDKRAIAQVLGLFNPNAVSDARMGPEVNPISRARPLDAETVRSIAFERSVERRQLKKFIEAADKNVGIVRWNWLDPSGDPSMNLGLNLHYNILTAKSMVIEAKARREQIEALLPVKALNAATDYNQALKSYADAVEGQQIQQRRLQQIDATFKATGKLDLNDLSGALQDNLNAGINAQVYTLAFRTARARVDRLMLQGYYVEGTMPPQIKR